MPNRLMRTLSPSSLFRAQQHVNNSTAGILFVASTPATVIRPIPSPAQRRDLAVVRTSVGKARPEVWFTSSGPRPWPAEDENEPIPTPGKKDHEPPDERTLRLGKTLRILQERLPTLLQTPLPQETLSPHITLHLFPSTHPHLPTVSGRVAYLAALWTAPVAWGRVPIVGNVKLRILSERMVKSALHSSDNGCAEKLIVRWKTCGKNASDSSSSGSSGPVDQLTHVLSGSSSSSGDDNEFSGIFIFEFDELGRILHHTIEHADEGTNWDRMGSRVISVTEWLLSKARGVGRTPPIGEGLALGCCEVVERRGGDRRSD